MAENGKGNKSDKKLLGEVSHSSLSLEMLKNWRRRGFLLRLTTSADWKGCICGKKDAEKKDRNQNMKGGGVKIMEEKRAIKMHHST